jgi:hypothetical protein
VRAAALLLLVFGISPAYAQSKQWSYWAATDLFITPDQKILAPTFMADRDWLHLEGRYNYEGVDSGSVWIGYSFKPKEWSITPMIGAVIGDTHGIAPGIEATWTHKKLYFYTEGEYVIADEKFGYFWTEFSYSPVAWLRAGVASQRTRLYKTSVDIQRGVFAGVMYRKASLLTYVFEPGSDNQSFVITAAVEF